VTGGAADAVARKSIGGPLFAKATAGERNQSRTDRHMRRPIAMQLSPFGV